MPVIRSCSLISDTVTKTDMEVVRGWQGSVNIRRVSGKCMKSFKLKPLNNDTSMVKCQSWRAKFCYEFTTSWNKPHVKSPGVMAALLELTACVVRKQALHLYCFPICRFLLCFFFFLFCFLVYENSLEFLYFYVLNVSIQKKKIK